MNRMLYIIFVGAILAAATMAYAENITMTTYYPAPFGTYDQIRLVPRAAAPNCVHGTMYVSSGSGNLEFCQSDGTWTGGGTPQWTRAGGNVYVTDITLNVGIGMINPGVKLDVNGVVRATAFIGDGAIPAGMVAMFPSGCPAGWSNFGAINGLFPRGSGAYGGTGGSATHNHQHNHDHSVPALNGNFTTSNAGDHSHDVDINHDHNFAGTTDATPHQCHNDDWENDHDQACNNHLHAFSGTTWGVNGGSNRTTTNGGDHNHAVNVNFGGTTTGGPNDSWTSTENSLPPYLDMIFCSKN